MLLLTDRESGVNLHDPRTGVLGVLNGRPGSELQQLDLDASVTDIEHQHQVQRGDLLVTAGSQDGPFPPDIPVARVVSVKRPAGDLLYRVTIRLLADPGTTEYVRVLAMAAHADIDTDATGGSVMMRLVRLALLLVALVLLQTTVFPHLRIAGVVPDLGLVVAVALAVRYGPELGAGFGFAAGLASDLFLQTPLGLGALAFGMTAYLVGLSQTRSCARPGGSRRWWRGWPESWQE